jgi:DNA-binding transcriptional MerR regulator
MAPQPELVQHRDGQLADRRSAQRSRRDANGYRNYDERLVDRVMQIRGLLEAGLPTRIIKKILPCLDTPGVLICVEEAVGLEAGIVGLEVERLA